MAAGSIIAGVAAFLCLIGGFVLSIVPVVGTILSFLAPVLSLVGIVLGGLAMSRARRYGEPSGLGIAGLIINVMAFIPALVVALTCGLCNACVTAGMLSPGGKSNIRYGIRQPEPPLVAPALPQTPDAGAHDAGRVTPPAPNLPRDLPPGAPPPAFPPPPMPTTGAAAP